MLRKITRLTGKAQTKDKLNEVISASYTTESNTDRVYVLRFDPTTALVCPPILSLPRLDAGKNATKFDELLREGRNRELYQLVTGPEFNSPEYKTTKDVATVAKVRLTDLTDFGHGTIVSTEA